MWPHFPKQRKLAPPPRKAREQFAGFLLPPGTASAFRYAHAKIAKVQRQEKELSQAKLLDNQSLSTHRRPW
jgi:hypothetical protein